MKLSKIIKKGIITALTAALLLTGCTPASPAETSDDTEIGAKETVGEENKETGESEKQADSDAEEKESAELAENLKEKYAQDDSNEYDGNVIKVDRDQPIRLAVGYNPWASDSSPYENFVIYQDADLKFPVDAGSYEYDAEAGVLIIEPPFLGTVEMRGSSDVDLSHLSGNYLYEDEGNGWGTLPQYYMKVCVDLETGETLPSPVITVIKVNAEIAQAPQVVFDQTEEGYARFSWKQVPEAEGYLLFRVNKDEEGLWNYGYAFADVKGTEWSSESEAFESDYDDSVLALNYRFQQFYASDDFENWIEEGDGFLAEYMIDDDYDEYYSEYYGVLAYNANGCSPISNLFSAGDLAHMLPTEKAWYSNNESFFDIHGIMDLPAVMCVTMCDGSTVQKVLEYDFDSMWEDEEFYCARIKAKALQTPFTEEFAVYDVDWDTLAADIEAVKERQEKLINKGGSVAPSMTVEENAEPDYEEQQEETKKEETESERLEIDVTANSALSEYIALNMLETKGQIDLSAFQEAADTQYVIDAFFEAKYQNPLILGVQGGSIDPENRILYVEYDFSRQVTAEKQEKIQLKVAEIVEEIIDEEMSDAQKEMAINAYLCENAYYDDDALENAEKYSFTMVDEEFYDSFTAYGILVNGVGVCASYSAAFKLLADEAGLESIVVTGYLDGSVPHAWNKVKVDDSWYIVDATNNDNDLIDNALLNLSDAAAGGTLVENDSYVMDNNISDYKAKTDELEYYHMENRYFDREVVADELAELLMTEGKAVLRTDYDINDEEFYGIAQQVADKTQKRICGFYWMGVIHLEE